MQVEEILGVDWLALLRDRTEELRTRLEELHPNDIAQVLLHLEEPDRLALLNALDDARGAEVIGHLPLEHQAEILERLDLEQTVALIGEMSPDDRVDLVQHLAEPVRAEIFEALAQTEPGAVAEIRKLEAWPEDTAGGLMTTEFVALSPDLKAWEAIEELRAIGQKGAAETVYTVYVTGYGNKLLGVLSLRDLILADPGLPLDEIMTENVVRVDPTDDQERVAETIARYDLAAVPVVDSAGRMLGVVTVDDVVDVVIEEATEDAQMMGGVLPFEDTYFATKPFEFIWKRAIWLIVLFVGQLLTATVMEQNEPTLAAMLELAVFIPLIIASGGNAGGQSSSLIIRALAVNEVRPADWGRVLARELTIGLSLGVVLGAIGYARAAWGGPSGTADLGVIVGLSITAIVCLGTLIGSLLPMIIQRTGLDPAVSSTPFVASLVDVLGLIVYFAVARWILAVAL